MASTYQSSACECTNAYKAYNAFSLRQIPHERQILSLMLLENSLQRPVEEKTFPGGVGLERKAERSLLHVMPCSAAVGGCKQPQQWCVVDPSHLLPRESKGEDAQTKDWVWNAITDLFVESRPAHSDPQPSSKTCCDKTSLKEGARDHIAGRQQLEIRILLSGASECAFDIIRISK